MRRTALGFGIAGLAVAVSAAAAHAKEKPKPTVRFARSWDAAVEEAKLLNAPIVVHSHGFY